MTYPRTVDLTKLLKRKSFFLFGPRSTGKTTLIELQLKNITLYDLLDSEIYLKLLKRPKIIEEEALDPDKIIVIDEIQKIPSLLDEVHRLIQKKGLTFLLTGSSARKLRHGGANLLAGRAWEAHLFSLTSNEIINFDLIQYLNRGGLPHVYGSDDWKEELLSYISTYLREEIQAEGLARNIQGFSEFLDAVAISNGQEINYAGMASDCQVSAGTLKNYFQILEDTLIGLKLPGYTKTKKRKAITRAKHYLFDIGIVNVLTHAGQIKAKSQLFGDRFEHFIILEVRAYNSYFRRNQSLTYWRTTSQIEVDLLVGDEVAIEIKSSGLVNDKHLSGIRALKEEGLFKKYMIVSLDDTYRRTEDGIEIYPWRYFLNRLWDEQLF